MLPARVDINALEFAGLHMFSAYMSSQEPGVLPVLVTSIACAEVTADLASLDGESAFGRPGMDVTCLDAAHNCG